jgi:hypothetical protein
LSACPVGVWFGLSAQADLDYVPNLHSFEYQTPAFI